MALRFIDSFDHYPKEQLNLKYNGVSTYSEYLNITNGIGRRGTAGFYTSHAYGWIMKVFEPRSTWIVGMAFKAAPSINVPDLLQFLDGTNPKIRISLVNNLINFIRPGATDIAGEAITSNTYNYLEVKVTIADAGSYEVRLNGVPILSKTGVDLNPSGVAVVNAVRIQGPITIDDLYICDDTGTENNDFLGDVRVELHTPVDVGALSQWTPASGLNYENVDETLPNFDEDYVTANDPGLIDTYQFSDITLASGTILGIQHCLLARKDDAGSRVIKPIARLGENNYEGSSLSVPDNYIYLLDISEENPETEMRWTVTDINNAEFGQKLES
jgi:hypothetical protein